MNLQQVLRVVLLASALTCAVLLALGLRRRIDHAAQAEYAQELRWLGALDTRLNEDLLRSRSGLCPHYDDLVRDTAELSRVLRALSETPSWLEPAQAAAFRAQLSEAGSLLLQKQSSLERFKTEHATLRNSRHAVPVLGRRLEQRSATQPSAAPLVASVAKLLAALLTLDGKPLKAEPAPLLAELEGLGRERGVARAAGVEQDLDLLLAHTRVIARGERVVNGLVTELLQLPLAARAADLVERHAADYRGALDQAAQRSRLMSMLALAVVVLGLTDVILRLVHKERALRQAHTELERVHASLATAHAELEAAHEFLSREREREQELGKLKTRFVQMTSHEFRTPLATILSSSQMLSEYGESWTPEKRCTHLERIEEGARNMKQMLEEILLIGKAEAGGLQPTPVGLDLERFCASIVAEQLRASGYSHEIQTLHAGPSEVWLDERLLGHILVNLIENALKYSGVGSKVVLEVTVTEDECRFVVRDAGIGIPPEDRPQLFDSFFRATNVGHVPGTGLGLAVVKHAVSAQLGSIEIESEPGRGSAFRVCLPRPHTEEGSRASA